MKKYDLLLFDLDGTLADPYEGMVSSFEYMIKSCGLDVPPDFSINECIGPPLRDVLRRYFNLKDKEAEAAVLRFREHQLGGAMYQNKLYDGILPLLSRLKAEGYALSVATSKNIAAAEKIAEYFDFDKYFDFIAGSAMDGSRNNKTKVINYALDNVDKARKMKAVLIGDRKYDIFGAKEVGIDSIGVLWGYGTEEELREAGADMLASDMDGLYTVLTTA